MPSSLLPQHVFPARQPLAQPLEVMLAFPAASLRQDPSLLERVLDYPCGAQPRSVQIHHGSLFELCPLRRWPALKHAVDQPQLEFLSRTLQTCHARGLRMSWMVGHLNPPAGLLECYPEMRDLHSGAYWELVESAVREIFDALPELDEFAVYLFEADRFLHVHHFFPGFHYGSDEQAWPYLAPADHLRLFLQAMSGACRARGKSFSVLTHAWYPFQARLLAEALRDFPPDLPLLLEHNYSTGDFNPHLPEPALLRQEPHRHHALLFCGGMEYNGLAEIPCCYPELMQERIMSAIDATPNVRRITFRPVWEGRCLLGTANEINLHAAYVLARDPLANTDEIWREWLDCRFGCASAEPLARILRSTYRANLQVFFTLGTRTNDHSRLPTLGYLRSRVVNYGRALLEWVPTPETRQQMWELLCAPSEKTVRVVQELHEDSLRTIALALAELEQLEDRLAPLDLQLLRGAFRRFQQWAQWHQAQMEIFIRLSIQRRKPAAGNLDRLQRALAALEGRLEAPASEESTDYALLAPDRVRAFLSEARAELGESCP
jgi:hypothetical protein